jgi:carbon starvation protein
MNVPQAKWAALGINPVELSAFSQLVNEDLAGRAGGAVTLAIGMAHIFSSLPGMKALMAHWYHFAIMFEALFILTTVDAGTRVARYLIQEVSGHIHPRLADVNHWPSVIATSALVSCAWGYMLYKNDVSSIWPMFGVANQLLAVLALIIGSGWLLKHAPKRRHALITAVPAVFMVVTTITAALANLFDSFLPRGRAGDFNGYLNAGLTVVMIACVVIVLVDGSARSWILLRRGGTRTSA